MERPKAKPSKIKISEVRKLKELMKSYPVLGLLDMTDLPALQLLRIKHALRDVLVIRMSKKRLLTRVFNELKDEKKGIDKLIERFKGLPALIFTKEDPFKLSKLISENKSMAPAKPGQTAPTDLIIPAGLTPFAAGPMIGELGAMGIKSKVEEGKISVIEDTVLVKEGDVIDDKKADLLSKLGIEPMEVGLNLILTFKDGEILEKEVLFVDVEEYINNIKLAGSESFALSLSIGYVTKDNIKVLLSKADLEAKALTKEAKIMTGENVGEELAKAEKQAESLKKALPEPKEEPKVEEKKEEPKVEEKPKEEPKVEEKKEEVKQEAPKEEPKPEPQPKEEVKVEGKKDISKEEIKQAEENLKNLVDKKIKGEI